MARQRWLLRWDGEDTAFRGLCLHQELLQPSRDPRVQRLQEGEAPTGVLGREKGQKVPYLHLVTGPCLETVFPQPAWAQSSQQGQLHSLDS